MRVIGEASIRLTASGESGLVSGFKREADQAAKSLQGSHILKDLDKNTDDDSKKIVSRLKSVGEGALKALGGLAGGAANAALLGGKLTLLATAAGAGLAGISSLVTGLIGFIGVVGQAAGVAGLLPAALLTAKAATAALQVGLLGVGDSVKALASGDLDKFNESLKALSPEAQKAIGSLRQFAPQIELLKKSTQDNLFRGLSQGIDQLVGFALPQLRSLFNGIALSINGAAKETLAFLNTTGAQSQVSSIFSNMRETIGNLAPAFEPFVRAFLDFTEVSSSFLPQLSTGLSNFAQGFAAKIHEAAASGELAAFFQKSIDTVKELFGVVKDFGAGFAQIFRAAQIGGGGFLSNLKNIAAQFKSFTQSAEGFDALITFFQSMHQVLGAVLPIFTALATVIAKDVAPVLADIATAVGPAITVVIRALGDAINVARPGIEAFAQGFATFLKGVAPALPAIGRLVSVLGDLLGGALEQLAPVIEQVAEVFADTLAEALPSVIPPLVELAKVAGQLLVAFAPLIPPLAKIAGQLLGALAHILQEVGPPLAEFTTQLIDELAPYIGPLVDAFVDLVDAILPLLDPFLKLVNAVLTPLLPLLGPIAQLLGVIAAVLKPLAELLGVVITGLGNLVGTVSEGLGDIFTLATNGFNVYEATTHGTLTRLNGYWDEHGKFVKGVVTTTAEQVVADFLGIPTRAQQAWIDLATDAQFGFDVVTKGAQNAVFDIVAHFLGFPDSTQRAWTDLGNLALTAFNKLPAGAKKGTDGAGAQIRRLPGESRSVFGDLSNILFGSGQQATKGFADGMTSDWAMLKARLAAQKVVNAISNFFPHSPAVEGPFSGTGWTPFRGRSLVEGFAKGILSGASAASGATALVMNQVAAQLSPTGSVDVSRKAAGAGAAGGAGTGGTLTQVINALPGMDILQLGDYVLQQAALGVTSLGTSLPVSRAPVQLGVDDNFALGVNP